jgi:two-component system KDP operon response regulator KdpE
VKILIIEEKADLRQLYQHDLQLDGYEVVTTGSAKRGLNLLEAASPDLVIVDVHTHDMHGAEAMGRLMGRCPRIPVLLNSAFTSFEDQLLLGMADAYIDKSPDTRPLRTKVREMLAPEAIW